MPLIDNDIISMYFPDAGESSTHSVVSLFYSNSKYPTGSNGYNGKGS